MTKTTQEREHELLAAIVAGKQANGYAPTRRELARTIGLSVTRIQQLVESCVSKGLLSRPARVARACVLNAAVQLKQEGRR